MKSLFKSNVSIKDFFSNQRKQSSLQAEGHISDSAIDNSSQSQFPFSQVEFPDTQEYSQNAQLSCSPSVSQTQSPGRRYGTLFGNGSQLKSKSSNRAGGGPSGKATLYQKQLQTNKAKAKERDERDVMNMMLSSVRECTADIQVAVDAVKENVQQGMACSEGSLSQALQQIQTHLRDHTSCIKQALEVKSDVTQKIASLESTVSLKEKQMETLQDEIKKLKAQKEERVVDELQKVYLECQENTTDNMQQMYNHHQHELEKLSKLNERHYKDLSNKTQEFHEQLQREQAETLKALYDNLLSEINKSLCGMSCGLERDIVKRVQALHQQNVQQIQSSLVKQLQKMNEHDSHSDDLKQHKEELENLQEHHFQQIQSFLGQKMQEFTHQQQGSLKEATDKLLKSSIAGSIKSKLEKQEREKIQQQVEKRYDTELQDLKERYQKEVSLLLADKTKPAIVEERPLANQRQVVPPKTFRPHLSCFSPTVLIERNDQAQSSAQPFNDFSLDAPSSKYNSTGSLVAARKTYQKCDTGSTDHTCKDGISKEPSKVGPVTLSGIAVKSTNQHALFKSPFFRDHMWTSKTLFNKTSHPSPIAAVRPVTRKQAEQAQETITVESQTQNEPQVPISSKAPSKKKRRKKAPKYAKKKKRKSESQVTGSQVPAATHNTQPGENNSDSEGDETTQYVAPQSESIFGQQSHKKRDNRFGIFDFHDEEFVQPAVSIRNAKPTTSYLNSSVFRDETRNVLGNGTRQHSTGMTVRHDDSSQDEFRSIDSSPSLSITDVIIRRKIKQEKSSPGPQGESVSTCTRGRLSRQTKGIGGSSSSGIPDGPLLLKRPVRAQQR